MRKSSRRPARILAASCLAGLAICAAVGPEAATAILGFAEDEQHTTFPFAPPGFRDVPAGSPALDDGAGGFDRLSPGGAPLSCRAPADGAPDCPALDAPTAAFRRVSLLLADAWQAGGSGETVSGPALAEALAGHPAWIGPVAVPCEPAGCDIQGVLAATAFLRLDARTLAGMDRDRDGAVTREEFRGVPTLSVHLLGTDGLGRDAFVRLLHGLRVSLLVGVIAALAAAAIGVTWGAVAGWAGGFAGSVMMRIVDVLYGLPYLFVVILLLTLAGPSFANLLLAIACVQWLGMARTVRGLVASLKHAPYVDAARTLGAGRARIVVTHVLPNARGPILSWAALLVPASIKEEAFLSFLGLGVQAPAASLGTLIADGAPRIADVPWLAAGPAAVLFVAVLSINLLVDDWNDPGL